MANVSGGSPRLYGWVHCFAAYLLTAIVVRELLVEYEAFNGIRHRYLLSREPHLRAVVVTNIPRHLRSASKITPYFKHVYPEAVKSVYMCQNVIQLERLIASRTAVLSKIEQDILLLCRAEKRKLFVKSSLSSAISSMMRCECCNCIDRQERLTRLYTKLENLNDATENSTYEHR